MGMGLVVELVLVGNRPVIVELLEPMVGVGRLPVLVEVVAERRLGLLVEGMLVLAMGLVMGQAMVLV